MMSIGIVLGKMYQKICAQLGDVVGIITYLPFICVNILRTYKVLE